MKKLLILLSLLIIAVLLFFILRKDLNHSGKIGTYDFAIPADQQIDQIFYASNDKNKGYLDFRKDDNGLWHVKNGKNSYEADTSSIHDLLYEILPKLEVQNPVSDAARENVTRQMALNATKAQFYHKGKLIKTFYAGDRTNDDLGTFMYLPGAERPCIVVKPGHRGYLTPFFNTDINNWRTLSLIRLSAAEISRVSAVWSQNPSDGFSIVHKGDEVQLLTQNGMEVAGNRNRMLAYLDMFGEITHEAGEMAGVNKSAQKDSVLSQTPFFSLIFDTQKGEKIRLNLYRIPVSSETYSPEDRYGNLKQFETETYWASVEGSNEIWVVQDVVMHNRMKKISDFR